MKGTLTAERKHCLRELTNDSLEVVSEKAVLSQTSYAIILTSLNKTHITELKQSVTGLCRTSVSMKKNHSLFIFHLKLQPDRERDIVLKPA